MPVAAEQDAAPRERRIRLIADGFGSQRIDVGTQVSIPADALHQVERADQARIIGGGSTVIVPVGGSTGTVDSVALEAGPPSGSSSVAASATIAPAARATRRRARSAIQSQTGDSRDHTIVRV